MSVLAYGRIVKRAKTPLPPGTKGIGEQVEDKLLTAVAALVPAEILAAHAAILTKTTKIDDQGVTTITNAGVLQWSLVALLVLALVLFVLGRGRDGWTGADAVRLLIPPVAFLVWTELVGTTSALTPWVLALADKGLQIDSTALFAGAVVLAVLHIGIDNVVNPPKQAKCSSSSSRGLCGCTSRRGVFL